MRGFQLWLNLPASEKMTPATYRDIPARDISGYTIGGADIMAIAGSLSINGQPLQGAVSGLQTDPALLDIVAGDSDVTLDLALPDGHTVMVYVYEGGVTIGTQGVGIQARQLARLARKGATRLHLAGGSRALLIAGKPLGEPIVHYGPFVMNSRAEIDQAIADYNAGRLTA